MEKSIKYCEQHHNLFVSELQEFLRIDSVSSDPSRASRVADCADWLAAHLRSIGLKEVEVYPTNGYPIVFAQHPGPVGSPTVLIYGHYDVVHEDPAELWESSPFEPTIRDGAVFARGAADDKGQLFLYVKAVESILKTDGSLPVQIKMIFEGEEEVGSENLAPFLRTNAEKLACDVIVISDTTRIQPRTPTITYGLRGLICLQVELQAAASDLHSGAYGGVIANPANELAAIIASMKDADNHITIKDFYDDVLELTDEEKTMLGQIPHDDKKFLESIGAPQLWGEKGYSTIERKWVRPTIDVNGIWAGYTGEGAKTVLPCKASAKISMRLVPNQDPEKIAELFERHFRKLAPPSVRVEIHKLKLACKPFLCSLNNPYHRSASKALSRCFGKMPIFVRDGVSMPFVADLDKVLSVPILLIGYSVPNDRAHAPNEYFPLENFFCGIRSSIYLLNEIANQALSKH